MALGREVADFARGALQGYDFAQKAEERDVAMADAKEKQRERDIERAASRPAGAAEADAKPDLLSRISTGFLSLFQSPGPSSPGGPGSMPQAGGAAAASSPPAAAPPGALGGAPTPGVTPQAAPTSGVAAPAAPAVPAGPAPPAPPAAPAAPQAALGAPPAPAAPQGQPADPSRPPGPQTSSPPLRPEQIVQQQNAVNGVRPGQPITRQNHLDYVQRVEEEAQRMGRPELGQRIIARYWAGLQSATSARLGLATAALQAGNTQAAARLLEQGYNMFFPDEGRATVGVGANNTLTVTRTGADGRPLGEPMVLDAAKLADMAITVADPKAWADLTLRRSTAAETGRHNRATEGLTAAGIAAADRRQRASDDRADRREDARNQRFDREMELRERAETRQERESRLRAEALTRAERSAVFSTALDRELRRAEADPAATERITRSAPMADTIWQESQTRGLRVTPETVLRGVASGRLRMEPVGDGSFVRLYDAGGATVGEISRETARRLQGARGGSGTGEPAAPQE